MNFNIDKDVLYELFILKNMRRKEVAEYFGCSDTTIKKYLKKYNIKKEFALECKNKERKVSLNCLFCGTQFEVQKFRTNSGVYKSKYCSYSCSYSSRYLGEDHKRRIRNEIASRRRARLKNQTPELSKEEKMKIKEYYLICPKGHEVDHIQPISRGGLHHPNNLQILSINENRKKWCK